jgi:hypothetical protein
MSDVAKYLESLPAADSIREQLMRNEQERKVLQKLLRIASQREHLPNRTVGAQQREAAHA